MVWSNYCSYKRLSVLKRRSGKSLGFVNIGVWGLGFRFLEVRGFLE